MRSPWGWNWMSWWLLEPARLGRDGGSRRRFQKITVARSPICCLFIPRYE